MGDLHALTGDGEIMVTGLEVSGAVTVRVSVLKDRKLQNPMLENDMHQWVMAETSLPFNEAGMLLSAAGNAEICQVVDPLLTARFGLSKDILKALQ